MTTTKGKPITPADVRLGATNSHGEYYRIGQDITVLWMPKYSKYLCMTCRLQDCRHIDVVHEYRGIPVDLRTAA